MNTTKDLDKILSKLPVQLNSEKVELNALARLESLTKEAKSTSADMVDSFRKAKEASQTGVKAAEEHLKNLKTISNLVNDARTQAETLGIDITKIKDWRMSANFLNGNPASATKIMLEKMKAF